MLFGPVPMPFGSEEAGPGMRGVTFGSEDTGADSCTGQNNEHHQAIRS